MHADSRRSPHQVEHSNGGDIMRRMLCFIVIALIFLLVLLLLDEREGEKNKCNLYNVFRNINTHKWREVIKRAFGLC